MPDNSVYSVQPPPRLRALNALADLTQAACQARCGGAPILSALNTRAAQSALGDLRVAGQEGVGASLRSRSALSATRTPPTC